MVWTRQEVISGLHNKLINIMYTLVWTRLKVISGLQKNKLYSSFFTANLTKWDAMLTVFINRSTWKGIESALRKWNDDEGSLLILYVEINERCSGINFERLLLLKHWGEDELDTSFIILTQIIRQQNFE